MQRTKRRSKISTRFRNVNILLFLLAFLGFTAFMLKAFDDVTGSVSASYAALNAVGASEMLSSRIDKELALLSAVVSSEAVINWLKNEDNDNNRAAAYNEIDGIINELYSENLYIGAAGSRVEYSVTKTSGFSPVGVLSPDNAKDAWFFECIESKADYLLNIGIDHELNRKRVWLNLKIKNADEVIGVICTGLDFSHMVWELFSNYENENMRGFVMYKDGFIAMDSRLINDDGFLRLEQDTMYSAVLDAPAAEIINRYLVSGNFQYSTADEAPVVHELKRSEYRRMTVAPIKNTDWSVVILSGVPNALNASVFIPIAVTILILLVLFAVAVSFADYSLIFLPLGKLDKSLSVLSDGSGKAIYGLDRNDEIGDLSTTIYDLFNKAHIDPLTGIYNRRFMENNLQRAIETLSRADGCLSVLMLDVDFFKKYNDTYGHDKGDECLKAVAGAIAASAVRSGDFAARYGGEEFVIVLPGTDGKGAQLIAEKLLCNVRNLNIPHEASAAASHVTVSVGVASGKVTYMQKWQNYIKTADTALYESKESGRNKYTFKEMP